MSTIALIQCPDCKHQVSRAAANCPQCGAPVASRVSAGRKFLRAFTGALATCGLLLAAYGASIGNGELIGAGIVFAGVFGFMFAALYVNRVV